jgi:4'-phosphopantetheinyl transferase
VKRNHENGQAGTSRPAPDEVQAWTVPLTVSADLAGLLFDLLSAGERIRARRFRLAQDQQRFVATHAALRLILGRCLGIDASDIAFETREGKPRLLRSNGMRFNLSHSGDLAMIAVAWDREVGIDIEQIGDHFELDGIAQRFFPAHEAAEWQALPAPQRVRAFYQMWVAKEALLKGTGEGLDPLGEPSTRAHDFAVQQLPAPSGYTAAVAVQGQGWHLTCDTFDIAASLKLVYA